MSYQNKKLELVYNDKNNNNNNLISMEKSPNKNTKNNFKPHNNNLISKNNILNQKDNFFSNDLLNKKNQDELNLSNINIEKTQKFIQNADILFTEENEDKEDGKVNEYNNNFIKKDNNSINNNLKLNDDLKDSISISIDEDKRIELANNLFDQSLTCKFNSSNDINLSLVSDKRREEADKLFESVSGVSLKKKKFK